MANHKSAAKRARQTLRKTSVNRRRKGAVKSAEKKVRALIANPGPELAKSLSHFVSQTAKAVKSGLIHPNTLARKQARLARAASKVQAQVSA